jgi:hypothetical protein
MGTFLDIFNKTTASKHEHGAFQIAISSQKTNYLRSETYE